MHIYYDHLNILFPITFYFIPLLLRIFGLAKNSLTSPPEFPSLLDLAEDVCLFPNVNYIILESICIRLALSIFYLSSVTFSNPSTVDYKCLLTFTYATPLDFYSRMLPIYY